jgi:hypothetical protein
MSVLEIMDFDPGSLLKKAFHAFSTRFGADAPCSENQTHYVFVTARSLGAEKKPHEPPPMKSRIKGWATFWRDGSSWIDQPA